MLTENERHHSSVEKEATAIVEAIRKWTEFLCGRHFTVITDQQSVAYTVCTIPKIIAKLKITKF